MENKLDILTRKLYDEGVEKARQEAEEIIAKAHRDAEKIVEKGKSEAARIEREAQAERESLQRKTASEMSLSVRQATGALKQRITDLVAGTVSGELAHTGFEDKAFVQELLMTLVNKWDISSGNLDLEVLLPAEEKARFEALVASKYKALLDKGLEVKVGNLPEAFVIRPKTGGYQLTFSEALFTDFFNRYLREFTKTLLFSNE